MPPDAAHRDGAILSVRQWPGVRAEYACIPPHEGATRTKPHQIGVSFSRHSGLVRAHAGEERESDVAAGAAFVTGAEPITWMRVREHTEAMELYPCQRLVALIAQQADVAITPSLGRYDPVVLSIASVFRRAERTGMYLSEVAASELAVRLATHLIDRYSDAPIPEPRLAGVLDFRRLRRVCEFVEADLGREVSVAALAGVAGLSPAHFSRAFKAATGLAPHQFVAMRRMCAAKGMLMAGVGVEAAAHRVGFSNLSHFRRQFRAHFGLAPGALRG